MHADAIHGVCALNALKRSEFEAEAKEKFSKKICMILETQ